ncbi:ORF-a protein [Raphanus sativus]|nr:ORF-a protein [Raphanus sativus]
MSSFRNVLFPSARRLQFLVLFPNCLIRLESFGPSRSFYTRYIRLLLIFDSAPPCGSITTRYSHPELGILRFEASPPLLATFTYDETPSYCIATLSSCSLYLSTIPISNRCLSQVFCLAGIGSVVYPVFMTSPAPQKLYRNNLYRENLLISSAKPMLRPPGLLLRLQPKVYKGHPSTGSTSPIGRGETDMSSNNSVNELLLNKILICSLLGNSWAWAWLHLLDHSSILRGFRVLKFY